MTTTEKKYPSRFCPFCGTRITSPIKYCETCGAKITWSIKEYQLAPYPWSPKYTYIITSITYGLFLLLTIASLLYFVVFFGISLDSIGIIVLIDPFLFFLLTLGQLVFILVPWAFVKHLKIGRKKLGVTSGGIKNFSKDIILGISIGAAMVPVILFLDFYEIIRTGYGPPATPLEPADLFWIGILCLSIIFIVAPTEEFLFRGFVQNSLDAHYGRIGGLLVASVIFGLAHLNPLIGVFQTIAGIFLGLLFQWRGRRLAGPFAAHATFDCLIIFLDAFFI